MKRIAIALVALSTLAGCETVQFHQDQVYMDDAQVAANLNTFVGSTIAVFMDSVPEMRAGDHYDTDEGRVFRFTTRGVSLVYPGSHGAPTVVRDFACQVDISTRHNGGSGASGWTVVGIRHTGACNTLNIGV